jgi:hypothetical protein
MADGNRMKEEKRTHLSRFCLITDHFDDSNTHVAANPERD